MATITFDDFMRQKSAKSSPATDRKLSSVSFFKINDGEEAVVRFAYTSPSEFEMKTCHSIKINNRFIRINCNRTYKEPVDNCALCKSADQETSKISTRFFVKMIQYVTEGGKIVPKPVMWDRTRTMAEQLNQFYLEYGNLSDTVFKIKREGTGLDTKYTIIPASPRMYTEDVYVKDFSGFDGWTAKGPLYKEYTNEEIEEILATGQLPQHTNATESAPVTSTPAVEKASFPPVEDDPIFADEPSKRVVSQFPEEPKPATSGPKRTYSF